MNLLLDTHVLLWWLSEPSCLSKESRVAIGNTRNKVYVSAVVIWEMMIKTALGKLEMPTAVEQVLAQNDFLPLSITVSHSLAVGKLPDYHQDPFDRMLIAQALAEGLTLVSRDSNIMRYPVTHIVA